VPSGAMGCGASQRVEELQPRDGAAAPRATGTSTSSRRVRHRPTAERNGTRAPSVMVRPHGLTATREASNAFCFECGIFCNLNREAPECPQCGGAFVQFLHPVESNWISADDPGAQDFAFDDQLENSISVSLAETPVPKKPTKKSFLETLQSVQLDQHEVDARSRSRQGEVSTDPKSNCSICRELFAVGDEIHQLPCHHEFHACCIQLWLQGSNTCPICRLQLPEADAEELESKNSPTSLEEPDKDELDKELLDELVEPLGEPRDEIPEESCEHSILDEGIAGLSEEEEVAWPHLPGALDVEAEGPSHRDVEVNPVALNSAECC